MPAPPPAPAPEGAAAAVGVAPCLRLRVETVMVNGGDGWRRVFARKRRRWRSCGSTYPPGAAREPAEERRAQYLLESLGVLELACLDQVSVCPGSTADYIIRADGNVHALCSFTAYVVPQLRALGWHVDLSPDYPYQVMRRRRPLVRARRGRRSSRAGSTSSSGSRSTAAG